MDRLAGVPARPGTDDAYRWERATGKTTTIWRAKWVDKGNQFVAPTQVAASKAGVSHATCVQDGNA